MFRTETRQRNTASLEPHVAANGSLPDLNHLESGRAVAHHSAENAGGRMNEILKYLLEAWKQQLEPILAPWWDSAGLWRTVALGFVTLMVVGWRFRDRARAWLLQPVKRQRDKHVFRQANAILPEPELYALLGQLERGQTVKLERFARFTTFLGSAGNEFFSSHPREAASAFLNAATELERFLAQSFSSPDQTELRRLAQTALRAYRVFRHAIREALIV